MTTIIAYPLQWPDGWKRTAFHLRRDAKFRSGDKRLSVAVAHNRVMEQLALFKVDTRNDVVVSTNIPLRLDGAPRSDQREPNDPGVAVYWRTKGGGMKTMAIDHYKRVADNLAAVAATLDAMRAIERHGGAQILDRAFTGFAALPPPASPWSILGIPPRSSRAAIEVAYRATARTAHPDAGGSTAAMAALNAARDAALKEIGS